MAVSTVKLNGTTLMTVNDTTTVASEVLSGNYFYGADGVKTSGTIVTKTSSNLSVSGATVTAAAGYYASDASASVSTMTLPTSAAASATSGYTLKATISRSTSDQYINIAPGYNSAGGYYKISAVANGSVTSPASISGSSATLSTGTNTLTLTKTISVTPSVTTAGYISSGTAGNSSVSLTASVTTKAAATFNTSSSDQSIASGTYLTGKQTIKAVTTSGISAGNIKSGVTVKVGDANDDDRIAGVTGTFTSDATATAGDILYGETAYVNGSLVTGSIVTKTSSDLTASGATVTVPAGYYASQATKSVDSGAAGIPEATKGTVSNHSISVTPSVTNRAGYIGGSTITGTAVTVSASELVSGSVSVNDNGTVNVTNYASITIAVPTGDDGDNISYGSSSSS